MIRELKVLSGISPVVFHSTNIHNLYSILKENKFRLTPVAGTESDEILNKGLPFYFSTSRTRNNAFSRVIGLQQACIQLDGRKLANKFKASPVDYWGPGYRERGYEQEDRIIHTKSSINNALSYITEVTLFINDNQQNKNFLNKLRFIGLTLSKNKIPCLVYMDRQSYKINNRRKATSILEFLKENKGVDNDSSYAIKTPSKKGRYLFSWLQLIKTPKGKPLSPNAKDLVARYLRGGEYYFRDAINSLSADMHSAKSLYKVDADIANEIQEFLFKNKMKIKDLIPFLAEKWSKP